MDKNLTKLAMQAKVFKVEFEDGSYYVISPEKLQEYSLSIVRECARIAHDAEPFQTYDLILRHFGIHE